MAAAGGWERLAQVDCVKSVQNMLVARILQEVDAELERLQTARNLIVAILASTPKTHRGFPAEKTAIAASPAPLADTVSSAAEATAAIEPKAVLEAPAVLPASPARRRGRPVGSRNRRVSVPVVRERTALTSVPAAGPVFVSAAELERRRNHAVAIATPKPANAAPAEGTLESLIREVEGRRASMAA